MDADLKKLKNLTKTMRKLGISHYKTPEIDISLEPKLPGSGSRPKARAASSESAAPPQKSQAQKQEDSLKALLWSAPGFQTGGLENG